MEEAIAAIATGAGRGAIGIIRLSGEGAVECVERVFTPLAGGNLRSRGAGRLVLGTLRDEEGRTLDQVLATFSLAPNSYTGEDTAELHCHGSPTVLQLAMEALFAGGARQAEAGEFTRRAYLNGKLDLCQAEAVIDLIDSETPSAARAAASQLEGALSQKLAKVYDDLVELLAHFQAAVDYPEEDIPPVEGEEIGRALAGAKGELKELLSSYERGKCLNQGLPCAIVGRPNVGKSTLLNALVGYERAIVTDIPGTTRDTVEERCSLGGVTLRLIDTAGIRATGDAVEQIGVERSRAAMERAKLILVVLDGSRPAEEEDLALARQAAELAPTLLVRSKGDLPQALKLPEELAGLPSVTVNAKGGDLGQLEERVAELFPQDGKDPGVILTNARQAQQAQMALQALESAENALALGFDFDAPLMDVETALAAIGGLTGREVQNDVVDRVFSRFCVGK